MINKKMCKILSFCLVFTLMFAMAFVVVPNLVATDNIAHAATDDADVSESDETTINKDALWAMLAFIIIDLVLAILWLMVLHNKLCGAWELDAFIATAAVNAILSCYVAELLATIFILVLWAIWVIAFALWVIKCVNKQE